MLDLTPDELLTTTRAVRRRLDVTRPVPTEVILDCLRLAVQAPSGGNAQRWRWLVVDDPALRSAIAESYRAAALGKFEAARDAATEPGVRRAYDGAVHLAKMLDDVPVLVIPCALGRVDGVSNSRAAGFYGSIIPAVWNFQLALRSRGLGSVYITAHLDQEAEVARLLGIPAGVTQVALIPVAYTRGTDFRPAARVPVEEVTYRNGWGRPVG